MFLVKIPNGTGRKPLVTRIDPLEVVSIPDSLSGTFVRQRAPRACSMVCATAAMPITRVIRGGFSHQARDHLQVEERTT